MYIHTESFVWQYVYIWIFVVVHADIYNIDIADIITIKFNILYYDTIILHHHKLYIIIIII